ncbi:MAG: hypothetical protein J6I68_00105 [Butyrivibrio sp.]|uniref:hypothetical protein n=1 Tax=Butyrivibrio sp. TaxID=28121 RepID=UPI001B739D14|nr:hypothetical protein [Butyrivibrio sp.]MBP3781630.1 hypothetical protein [Butyrivibrio sp.]
MKGKRRKYKDLQGREFNSLSKLCEANEALYNTVYNCYHNKGMTLESAIREGQKSAKKKAANTMVHEKKAAARKVVSSDMVPFTFTPKTKYPGREYIAWFEWHRDYMWKYYKDGFAAEKAQEVLNRLDRFWIGLLDAVACNDKELMDLAGDKMIQAARMILEHPYGDYKDIYEVFAKRYGLGKYGYAEIIKDRE